MKCTSWPAPPIHSGRTPPQIPPLLMMFGTPYRTVDGCPVLDIPSAPLDHARINEWVNQSFGLFIKLVRTFDPEHLNGIGDVHVQINEALNMAAEYEGPKAIGRSKNKQAERRIELYERIKKVLG